MLKPLWSNISKRARHQPGFHASLFDDCVYDRGLSISTDASKSPCIYEVERIVSKRNKGGNVEYFIQWKNYPSTEITWEPSEHLPEGVIVLSLTIPSLCLHDTQTSQKLASLFKLHTFPLMESDKSDIHFRIINLNYINNHSFAIFSAIFW